jgi:arsenical pump membrane protein
VTEGEHGDAARGQPAARLGWLLLVAGLVGAAVALALRPAAARQAAAQDWSPFVLVAGLLLIGLVADGDGLFGYAGRQLARVARSGALLFAGAVVIVAAVTVTLNLDTSVAFLTPVLAHTARSRRAARGDDDRGAADTAGVDAGQAGAGDGAAGRDRAGDGLVLIYACLLLSNAGSLLLPGSNLTNLIVLGHLHLTGGQFVDRMWLPWLAALLVTAAVVAVGERRSLRALTVRPAAAPAAPGGPAAAATAPDGPAESAAAPGRPVLGTGLVAVLLATVAVVALGSPALPVAAIGAVAVAVRLVQRRVRFAAAVEVLGLPVLAGLFGVAVALGALGRAWAGPATLLSHLDGVATAALAGLATVALNNLPAASLLAARAPSHPFALLVGLNLGPNLCVTGSLAWLLWLRAARGAGAAPSLARASRLGLVAVPLSMALALGALALTGTT